jgi:hypothetical protein
MPVAILTMQAPALYLNSYLDNPMTNTLCAEYLAGRGSRYAGIKYVQYSTCPKILNLVILKACLNTYSHECFCGNSPQNAGWPVDAVECNMSCSGTVSR